MSLKASCEGWRRRWPVEQPPDVQLAGLHRVHRASIETFTRIDTNSDGVITRDELCQAFESVFSRNSSTSSSAKHTTAASLAARPMVAAAKPTQTMLAGHANHSAVGSPTSGHHGAGFPQHASKPPPPAAPSEVRPGTQAWAEAGATRGSDGDAEGRAAAQYAPAGSATDGASSLRDGGGQSLPWGPAASSRNADSAARRDARDGSLLEPAGEAAGEGPAAGEGSSGGPNATLILRPPINYYHIWTVFLK